MQLTTDDRQRFLLTHPSWELDREEIVRTFKFSGFPEAVAFVTECSFAAERADHHPDIDIRWNRVTITLTTHSEGGLTAQDTTLAATIDRL